VPQDRQALYLTWGERIADRVPTVRGWAQFLLADQPPAAHRVSESLRRPFGQFWTGLLDSGGNEKLAAQTFRGGMVAERRGRKGLTLWGRLRLGSGQRLVWFERSLRGRPWRRLGRSFAVDGRGRFSRPARYVSRTRYRLVVDGVVTGLEVQPVGKVSRLTRRKPKRR
jgi:hypothetical protein